MWNGRGGKAWFFGVSWALALLAGAAPAFADCEAKARAELTTFENVVVERAVLDTKVLANATCPKDRTCRIAFFGTNKAAPAPATPPGYAPLEKRWASVGTPAGVPAVTGCDALFEYLFEKKPTEEKSKEEKEKGAKGETAPSSSESRNALRSANDAKTALDAFKKSPGSYTALPSQGAAHGAFDDAAAETLQILGQIVVDRASAKGYALLQARLEDAFACSSAKTHFPATCAVLRTLRLQDIAMAPQVLASALGTDLLKLLEKHGLDVSKVAPASTPIAASKLTPADSTAAVSVAKTSAEEKLFRALYALSLSLFTKPSQPTDLLVRRALSALTDYVAEQKTVDGLSPGRQAAIYGVLAFARCEGGDSATLAGCNVSEQLEALGAPDAVRPGAGELAQRLVAIVSAPGNTGQRVQLSLDTVADATCMVLTQGDPEPTLACPPIESLATLDPVAKVAFAQGFVDATFDKDAMRFTVVAARLVDLVWADTPEDKSKGTAEVDRSDVRYEKRSALRLLAGLLDYAATYAKTPGTGEDDPTADDLHAQRTKILESLTEDMTDRTGREGDTIVSLAGSLRVVAGFRIPTKADGVQYWGPLSLPLGIALTHVPKRDNGWGFHMQFNAVDLGNYLALEDGAQVKKPEAADAFSIGGSIGLAYGPSLPFVLTLDGGYTPEFKIDPQEPDKRGAFHVGVALGIHVPLIDLN
jgi:hypothetical protein